VLGLILWDMSDLTHNFHVWCTGDMAQRMRKHNLEDADNAWPKPKQGEPKLSNIAKQLYFWEFVAPLTWKEKMGREARKHLLRMASARQQPVCTSHAMH
jgi:hypothetical protein